jgi:hypothetical protein
MNLPTEGQSDCARAMAEAERVLRELAFNAPIKTRILKPCERSAEGAISGSCAFSYRAACPGPQLDFVLHKDGVIELTEVGFRRMAQAQSAAIDVVLGIDSRDVLRFPA